MKHTGFTLVEVLTAVAIIVILSAISFIQYSRIQENARINGALAFDAHLNRILGSALAGEWKLDGNAEDSSGNKKNGTPAGVTYSSDPSDCITDQCALFDDNDYIQVGGGDNKNIARNKKGTISAWAYRDFDNGSNFSHTAISIGYDKDPSRIEFFYNAGVGKFWCHYYDSYGDSNNDHHQAIIEVDPRLVPKNKWAHIAMSWDMNLEEFKCYVDGIQIGDTQNGATVIISTEYEVIGASAKSGAPDDSWKGRIDEVRIYDKYFD